MIRVRQGDTPILRLGGFWNFGWITEWFFALRSMMMMMMMKIPWISKKSHEATIFPHFWLRILEQRPGPLVPGKAARWTSSAASWCRSACWTSSKSLGTRTTQAPEKSRLDFLEIGDLPGDVWMKILGMAGTCSERSWMVFFWWKRFDEEWGCYEIVGDRRGLPDRRRWIWWFLLMQADFDFIKPIGSVCMLYIYIW